MIRFLTASGEWRYHRRCVHRLLERPGDPRHRWQRPRRHRANVPHPRAGDLERRQPSPDARRDEETLIRRTLPSGRRGRCLPPRLGRLRASTTRPTIRIVASAGESEILKDIEFGWGDDELGQVPSADRFAPARSRSSTTCSPCPPRPSVASASPSSICARCARFLSLFVARPWA